MKTKKLFPFLFLVSAIASCTKHDITDDDNSKFCITDSLKRLVSIDTVKEDDVTGELNLSGKITFNEDKVVKIFPLAGGTVMETRVSLGDYVKAGEVLAVIKSADVAGILSDAAAAESDAAIAKKNLDVAEELYKSGVNSEKEFLTAQKEYKKAEASLNKSKEILKIYGESENNLSSYIIKSPISGFVVEKKINPGMEIRGDNSDNLFTVSDLSEVWAIANVYESDISKIQAGYDADVSTISYTDKIFRGKVDQVFSALNPDTKVLNVKIRLSNPDYLLKPGMFARINVHYHEGKKMLFIPSSAVIFDDNKNYVVRYKNDCDVTMQKISVFKTAGTKTIIEEENLHKDDLIVNNDALFIFTALKKL